MARIKGVTTAYRGIESLGKVTYHFDLEHDGHVTGSIVLHVDHITLLPIAPRVPANFLPQTAGILTDLHLSLVSGRVVEFLVGDADGTIVNGRLRSE